MATLSTPYIRDTTSKQTPYTGPHPLFPFDVVLVLIDLIVHTPHRDKDVNFVAWAVEIDRNTWSAAVI